MDEELSTLALNLGVSFLIAIAVIWFIYQAMRYKTIILYLFIALSFCFLGIMVENVLYIPKFKNDISFLNFIFAVHLTLIAFYLLFMFLFINSLIQVRPSMAQVVFAIFLLAVMVSSVWEHAIYYPNLPYEDGSKVVTIGRLANDVFGIYVYIWCGVRTYYLYWHKTHEKSSLVFVITQVFLSVGYIVRAIRELWCLIYCLPRNRQFPLYPGNVWDVILTTCNVLDLIAIVTFLILYISNIGYILRFPQDIYFLGIYTLSGLKIYRASFKTKKNRFISDKMFSGIFSMFQSIFKALFKAQLPIDSIESEDFSLFFKTRGKLMVVLAADHPNFVLHAALARFLWAFDRQFPEISQSNILNLTEVQGVHALIQRYFPFVKIVEE